jgi:hypothetical protein
MHERVSRLCVQLDGSQARAVLSAVMLLFHQQVKLIESLEGGTLLLLVVGKRLAQADECQAAFMFYGIAHTAGMEDAKVMGKTWMPPDKCWP